MNLLFYTFWKPFIFVVVWFMVMRYVHDISYIRILIFLLRLTSQVHLHRFGFPWKLVLHLRYVKAYKMKYMDMKWTDTDIFNIELSSWMVIVVFMTLSISVEGFRCLDFKTCIKLSYMLSVFRYSQLTIRYIWNSNKNYKTVILTVFQTTMLTLFLMFQRNGMFCTLPHVVFFRWRYIDIETEHISETTLLRKINCGEIKLNITCLQKIIKINVAI